jgi:hypothetical protein
MRFASIAIQLATYFPTDGICAHAITRLQFSARECLGRRKIVEGDTFERCAIFLVENNHAVRSSHHGDKIMPPTFLTAPSKLLNYCNMYANALLDHNPVFHNASAGVRILAVVNIFVSGRSHCGLALWAFAMVMRPSDAQSAIEGHSLSEPRAFLN